MVEGLITLDFGRRVVDNWLPDWWIFVAWVLEGHLLVVVAGRLDISCFCVVVGLLVVVLRAAVNGGHLQPI